MKILLSAYACEPNKGSEPGVGWNWALALARRGYEVHVLTRTNNREAIENERGKLPTSLHFHFFDYPARARFWKYWPGGIYLYYLLWQIGASRVAATLHQQERFDLVQHITFVSFRQPSFMGRLGIPFIFGPVGGGESMPPQLRKGLPLPARLAEALRNAGNRFVSLDPFMRRTYTDAHVIPCATEETLMAIPQRFRSKCIVQRAIGIDRFAIESGSSLEPSIEQMSKTLPTNQFLFVGRLLYWKGLHLALRALATVKDDIPNAVLRVIGEGGDAAWLRRVAGCAGVADRVEWVPRVAHSAMRDEYGKSVCLIFPSLHDSGGMVVPEAMAASVPVICLDRGGPGSIVDSTCGFIVCTKGQSEEQIINLLATAMIRLSVECDLRARLAAGARHRARELRWDDAAEGVYGCASLLNVLDHGMNVSN
ncbi:MAG TPA: glycosyltransferase family 4 protein [Terracidiphilus sp.]